MTALTRATHLISIASTLGTLLFAFGVGAEVGQEPKTCLFAENQICQVVTPHIGITVGFDANRGESLLTMITPSPSGYIESKHEIVRPDLEAYVVQGEIDSEDARLIEAEMLARPQTSYFVPSDVQLLLDDVGFPSNKVITAAEYVELLQVHMQLALDISPLTASFLVERLGIAEANVSHSSDGKSDPTSDLASGGASEGVSGVAETSARTATLTAEPTAAPVIKPSIPSVIETDTDAVAF